MSKVMKKSGEPPQTAQSDKKKSPQANVFAVLSPYLKLILVMVFLAFGANGLNLFVPKLISGGIDAYSLGTLDVKVFAMQFIGIAVMVFVLAYLQSVVQTYVSEKVARELREKLSAKISLQSYAYVQDVSSSKLLTNLTSDVDAVKMFVAQAVVSIASSVFLIIGGSLLLLSLDWKLAIAVLLILPVIGATFFIVFSKVRVLFRKTQEIIDWLNKVINESILGAALIRVLNSQHYEYEKFLKANTEAKNNSLNILKLFAGLIPIITLLSNMAVLVILVLGGYFVINGEMTLGTFAAFNIYISILIFPIFILGFMSTVIARASASYGRIVEVLNIQEHKESGTRKTPLLGNITLDHLHLNFGEKSALQDVSFSIKHGTRTAIIGPTAAGKSQLLALLTGLTRPTSGQILFDEHPLDDYDTEFFHHQVGIVFQDSVIFNLSLRENIAFSATVKDSDLRKAIETAELTDFIDALPEKLNTIVSERGASLSGGQKQRIMLARALALNPKILFLDDFTARVDANTEKKILNNVDKNYPGITLISVTQKISSVEHYDQIIVLMEGELLAIGKHMELLESSPEYVQIFNSQRSTSNYELHAE